MKIPYERIVAWLAGPISILAGYLATQLVAHVSLFNSLGITHDQTAKAIVAASTFLVGAGVTYLAHAKWLDNLTKWWAHQGPQAPQAPVRGGTNVAAAFSPMSPDQPNSDEWLKNRSPDVS